MTEAALQSVVTASGRTIAWREAGSGPVLLLLHGIGSGSLSWQGQLAALSDRFRVIAWDAPGYGGSDFLPDEVPTASDYGQSVADLLNALEIDRVHLVGHSLGALIGAGFCALAPDRLLTVTFADPAGGYAKAGHDIRVGRLEARLKVMADEGPEGMARNRAGQVLAPDPSPETLEKVRRVQRMLRPEGYAQAAKMLHSSDIFDHLSAIDAPTLVMCGTEDKVTPEEGAKKIAAAVSGAVYEPLPELGHASYVEGPEVFNAALRAFLERVG